MRWVKIGAELALLSRKLESNELSRLASESETTDDLLPERVNCLLIQEVEVVGALLAVVVGERNQLWVLLTLSLSTEIEHLSESRSLVGYEEEIIDVIVPRPANLSVRV